MFGGSGRGFFFDTDLTTVLNFCRLDLVPKIIGYGVM